ncbi:MAG: class I SAM-dependent methyltransferase [Bacteroidetes bacterium]|nr:class I SAM-dependent methyltransferase [Bacteroidota bacterium]
MNDLEAYFENNTDRLIDKWTHYFEVYDRHFSKYRGKEITILEIGTWQGGSLQMWKSYFGDKAMIYGMDINSNCKQVEEEHIKIFIGSQSDRKFLRRVKQEIPPIDILIDDGGHTMLQQIVTFEELFDHVKPDGLYLCEDIHTSYWTRWGGGYRRRGTFVEYAKNFIDQLNAYHSREKGLKVSSFTRSVTSLHFYDSMLVIEKGITSKPDARQTGRVGLQSEPEPEPTGLQFLKIKFRYMYRHKMNRLLNLFGLPFKNGDMIQ